MYMEDDGKGRNGKNGEFERWDEENGRSIKKWTKSMSDRKQSPKGKSVAQRTMLNFRKTRTAVMIAVVRYADNQLTTLPPEPEEEGEGDTYRWLYNDDDDDDDDVWHENRKCGPSTTSGA
ncbi:unnamed protein product [Litomosoides sigmodontis]|uniref:Uncharacterized protein n=1 Tax=Litomosoides sigmodontis TaxID=42156 RepID=A0A3P6V4I9_LITSI|nr:unnamed protein product [Litomosoides sigmodontis]